MKKNILTIIILAMSLINIVMSAVLIFVVVPTSNKTNNLVSKIASIIDLELESPVAGEAEISVSDITTHPIADKLTINLKESDDLSHYAVVIVSLSINNKNEEAATLEPFITDNENAIKEIVTEEFSKFTIDEVINNKSVIKENILTRIHELFNSDFIINVSFGNIILQ